MWALILLAWAAGCRGDGRQPSSPPLPSGSSFTFAVVGDNRGSSTGEAAPAFVKIVERIRQASPALLLNTGDIINGYVGEDEAHLRKLWDGYQAAIAPLKMPVYHVPGNHDIFDSLSARLWKERWGPTYYAFEYGGARFIALDTETERGRVGAAQFEWLRRQVQDAGDRKIFLFLHRPLFPVDGHIGSSLDEYPEDRDRLHRLFVEHRERIKGVYVGHEHLYYHELRDGVPYYTVAGGGAPLYAPREMGGYFYYLLVNVTAENVSVKVNRIEPAPAQPRTVKALTPGTVLESWESPLFWYVWDPTMTRTLTGERVTEGRQGLKMGFDLSQYQYPTLSAPLHPARDLSRVDSLKVDVFVPGTPSGLTLMPVILKKEKEYEVPPVSLKPGWNTVTADLNGKWLPPQVRRSADQIQWTLASTSSTPAGYLIFDNLRPEGGPGKPLQEGWENPLQWGAWNETLRQEAAPDLKTHGRQGLKLRFDLARFGQPRLYAALSPLWDLRGVSRLAADVYAPQSLGGKVALRLVFQLEDARYEAPPVVLKGGWNRVTADVTADWLPGRVRNGVEQVEWVLSGEGSKPAGWIVLDNFRAVTN